VPAAFAAQCGQFGFQHGPAVGADLLGMADGKAANGEQVKRREDQQRQQQKQHAVDVIDEKPPGRFVFGGEP
jgi:hypothetical protein